MSPYYRGFQPVVREPPGVRGELPGGPLQAQKSKGPSYFNLKNTVIV